MTPASENNPGGRQSATPWTDSSGNFWLYGGHGLDSAGVTGELNDFWEFNPSTNQWAWMGGSSTFDPRSNGIMGQLAVYGVLQTPNFANTPGGLDSATSWTGKDGNLWLYGGYGYDANGTGGDFDDLWEYQPNAWNLPVTAAPSFSLGTGAYEAGQILTISDATPGASIFYFIDGATAPAQYTDPITIPNTETIEAIAVAPGYANSVETTSTYTVQIAAAPTFSITSGTYATTQTVSISDTTPGVTIYYAINGAPTTSSNVYNGQITVSSTESIEAIAVASGYAISATASAAYTIWPASALNEWAWMGGLSTGAEAQVYGALGTPAVGNIPSARFQASSWTDKEGNLWLFGGNDGFSVSNNNFVGTDGRNDLWRFNPATNEWAWMGGNITTICTANTLGVEVCTQSQPGVYGTLGTPAGTNIPGGRGSAANWTDDNGNLWLFGGQGLDASGTLSVLNDLWELNPSTNQWAWRGGSSTIGSNCFEYEIDGLSQTHCAEPGVYGTLKTPAAGNIPASRTGATTWADSTGNFWLFGGWGYDVPTQSQFFFNDLWKYSPSTNQWSWMSGSNTAAGSYCFLNPNIMWWADCGQAGVYGTLGTPSAGSIPGGRSNATGWIDGSGNLWLYAGWGFDANGDIGNQGFPDDLWKFSPATNEWTWMGGSSTIPEGCTLFNDSCVFPVVSGTVGTPAPGNFPGPRFEASSWTDKRGNFWLYSGSSNDFWEFYPSTNAWAWMGGSTTIGSPGEYGILGTPAPGNNPGERQGATSWTDGSGNFWLFGGEPYIVENESLYDNDLWEYQSSSGSLPTAATPTFSVATGTYSGPQTVTISDTTNGATIYYTLDGSTPTRSSTWFNSSGTLTVAYSETIKAMAVASDCYDSAVASAIYTMSAQVAPPTFSPPAGTYTSSQTVSISDASPNVYIYYTTDGTTPTSNSPNAPVFILPAIRVMASETIEAIAVAYGYSVNSGGASTVATANYTINLPLPPSFTVGGTAVTVLPGATTGNTSTITLTPSGGFTGSVALTAAITGSPSGAQYPPTLSFGSSSPVSISGTTAGTATLTISTTAPKSAALTHPKRPGVPWYVAGGATLACLLLFGIPARRRRWQTMLGMLALFVALSGGMLACSGGGSGGGGGGEEAEVVATVIPALRRAPTQSP
jgi:N-acetylneuraminic acid mutarotase